MKLYILTMLQSLRIRVSCTSDDDNEISRDPRDTVKFSTRQWTKPRKAFTRIRFVFFDLQHPSDVLASFICPLLAMLLMSWGPQGISWGRCLLVFYLHHMLRRGIPKDCENLMEWGSTTELRRELALCVCVFKAFHANILLQCIHTWAFTAESNHDVIFPFQLFSLWISKAAEGGVYFSRDARWEDFCQVRERRTEKNTRIIEHRIQMHLCLVWRRKKIQGHFTDL